MASYLNTGAGSGAYGRVPIAPPIGPTAAQSTDQAILLGQKAYEQLPFYNESLQNVGRNIRDMSAGIVPEDVKRQRAQWQAERGVGTGTPGSPSQEAGYQQALGLTSLDLIGRGQQALNQQLPQLPGAQISQNPNFYVNPSQQYEADLQKAIYEAAPDPTLAAGAAMGAARSGFNAGYGTGGYSNFQPGAGFSNSNDWWNAPEPNYQPLVAYGPGGGGAGGGTGGSVDAIVSKYNQGFVTGPRGVDETQGNYYAGVNPDTMTEEDYNDYFGGF